jgi:hypothetical protein
MSKFRNLRESSGAEEGQGTAPGSTGQTGGGYREAQRAGRGGAELAGRGEQLVRVELDGAEKSWSAATTGRRRADYCEAAMEWCDTAAGRRWRSGPTRRQGAAGGGWAEPYRRQDGLEKWPILIIWAHISWALIMGPILIWEYFGIFVFELCFGSLGWMICHMTVSTKKNTC